MQETKKNILVNVLNWGLGHAVRSSVIIRRLKEDGHRVYIASDGIALRFLQKEFPELPSYELPAYGIDYKRSSILLNVLVKTPKILGAIIKEKHITNQLCKSLDIDLLISDNRLACYNNKVESIYISHQLELPIQNRILAFFANGVHRLFIRQYHHCCIPDLIGHLKLAGRLSQASSIKKVTYLGILSELKTNSIEKDIPVLAVLSGPEPQRSHLEQLLIQESKALRIQLTIIRGTDRKQATNSHEYLSSYDLLDRKEIQHLMDRSEIVISRSGYTSLMDIYAQPTKVFFIPTPGQWEQEYLAKHWAENFETNFSAQKSFSLKAAVEQASYPDFSKTKQKQNDLSYLQTRLSEI